MGIFDRFKSTRDESMDEPAPQTIGSNIQEPIAESAAFEAESQLSSSHEGGLADEVSTTPIDFDDEFALPPLVTPATETPQFSAPASAAVQLDEAELEEWSEPLPSVAPTVMADGSMLLTPDGPLIIEDWLGARGGENVYRATYEKSEEAQLDKPVVRLRQSSGVCGERLSREAMWRTHLEATTRLPMLPRFNWSLEDGENVYLATEMPAEGPTLAEFLTAEDAKSAEHHLESEKTAFFTELLLVLTQIAAFLTRLHSADFAHLSLRPEGIVLGKPVQILDCSFAMPLGEALETPLSFAGYSAPELSRPGIVDARSDLYAVGAMLYRAVTGADVPESGADFTTWRPRVIMAGVPQILRRTLGEIDTRYNSAAELHRALVKLKNRLRPVLSHTVCGLSTIGLESSRSTNQDAYGFQSGAWETENGPLVWSAFCVADGMGGMAAGEVASEIAVATFLRAASLWSAESASLSTTALPAAAQAQLVKEWAALANEEVVNAMVARGVRGGCTMDAGLVIDRRLCIAHVGDSRLYLLRGDKFEVLSRDHSFVMSLLLQGQITFDDIRTHNDRNKVTRSLGERHPQPDYFIDGLQVQKSEISMDLQKGDVLLACSDGLWEPVLENEMLATIAENDLPQAAREMLKIALRRGAPDNATLVLMRLDEDTSPMFA